MSHLADTVAELYRICDAMKANGASVEERAAVIEKALRLCWPVTREWKYLCSNCDDYGLEMHTCPGDATCGRSKEHLPHDYGLPCWCTAGAKFRKAERTPDDAVTRAAATKKPSRFGR